MNNKLRSIIHPQDSRSRTLRNNILLSSLIKVAGLCTSFLVVPVTLNYLAPEQYGIWMTLSSILFWFSFFDVGLGNGMRNYLAQAIAQGDSEKGRTYLTTTLVMLAAIALILMLVMVSLAMVLDMNSVFNTTAISNAHLRQAVIIACVFTLIVFVVKNVGMVYVALQHYAMNDLLIVSGNVAALILIYICTKVKPEGSLSSVVLIFTSVPVAVFLLGAIPLFRRHPELRPTPGSFNRAFGRQLLSKGIGFFFIQITSCLVIFGGSNIFITQYAGPEAVTVYNIAYKYFNLLAIAYTIVVSPMWNAYTDAYVKGDYAWIRRTFSYALAVWGVTIVAGLLMLASAPYFYSLWIGDTVSVPMSVSASVLVFISFFNLNNCVTMLINGLNKIYVQIITSVAVTAVYIAAVLLGGGRSGIEGIVGCMSGSYAVMSIIHLYQCRLLIRQRATGIWNK